MTILYSGLAQLLLCSSLVAAELPAAFVAGSVVRSEEFVIRRGVHREEEFIGKVRYESAGTRLTADWALFKNEDRAWQARGAVSVRRIASDGAMFEAHGEQAAHDDKSQDGFLNPAPGKRVLFSRTPANLDADHGESGRIAWNAESRLTFSGGVKVWGPRLELAAEEAVYEKTTGRLRLTGGRPVLRKVEAEWTSALKADEVVATETPQRVEARGRVKGWMIFKDRRSFKKLAQ